MQIPDSRRPASSDIDNSHILESQDCPEKNVTDVRNSSKHYRKIYNGLTAKDPNKKNRTTAQCPVHLPNTAVRPVCSHLPPLFVCSSFYRISLLHFYIHLARPSVGNDGTRPRVTSVRDRHGRKKCRAAAETVEREELPLSQHGSLSLSTLRGVLHRCCLWAVLQWECDDFAAAFWAG
ncbi:hypothetical protein EDD85DRAFT_511491 [Armillaria nabsnona]|nr:hypothetical protein EDD85DRAFT_511491 [Armillaria nabsnona]